MSPLDCFFVISLGPFLKLSAMSLEAAWDLESDNSCVFLVLSPTSKGTRPFDPSSSSLKEGYDDLLSRLSGGWHEIMKVTWLACSPAHGSHPSTPSLKQCWSLPPKAELCGEAALQTSPSGHLNADQSDYRATRPRLPGGRTTSTVKSCWTQVCWLCVLFLDNGHGWLKPPPSKNKHYKIIKIITAHSHWVHMLGTILSVYMYLN